MEINNVNIHIRRYLKKLLAIVTLIAMLSTTMSLVILAEDETADDSITISILATSDMHGRIYPYQYATDDVDKDAGFAKL